MRSGLARAPAPPAHGRPGIRRGAACRPGERSSARCSVPPPPPRGRRERCRGTSPAADRRCGAARRSRRRPAHRFRDGRSRPAPDRRPRARPRYDPADPRRGERRVPACRARCRRGRCRSTRRARSSCAPRAAARCRASGGVAGERRSIQSVHGADNASRRIACAPHHGPGCSAGRAALLSAPGAASSHGVERLVLEGV